MDGWVVQSGSPWLSGDTFEVLVIICRWTESVSEENVLFSVPSVYKYDGATPDTWWQFQHVSTFAVCQRAADVAYCTASVIFL